MYSLGQTHDSVLCMETSRVATLSVIIVRLRGVLKFIYLDMKRPIRCTTKQRFHVRSPRDVAIERAVGDACGDLALRALAQALRVNCRVGPA